MRPIGRVGRRQAARARHRHHQRGRIHQGRRLALLYRGSLRRLRAAAARAGRGPLIAQGKDREEFAEFYKYATEKGTLFYEPGEQIRRVRPIWVCTGPITYTGGSGAASARSRCSSARCAGGGRVPHHDRAGEPRGLSRQRVLQERGRIRLRHRRGDARRIRGDRRCRASCCRSTTRGCRRSGTASACRWGWRPSASAARCASRRLNHALRKAFPRTACAITSAGAAGTGRTPTISR